MRRVNVVGSAGVGKTTFARALATKLGAPCIELDALFWQQGNWMEPDTESFRRRVEPAISGDAWVVDGNYQGRIGTLVWEPADTVVWLDLPLWVSLWRILRRSIPRVLRREVLWVGNRETFRNMFLSRNSLLYFALRTHRGRRRRFAERLARPEVSHLRLHRFRSNRDAERWLVTLEPEERLVDQLVAGADPASDRSP